MEKCTFCIQRIEEAKIARLVEAGPRNERADSRVQDGLPASLPERLACFREYPNLQKPGSRARARAIAPM